MRVTMKPLLLPINSPTLSLTIRPLTPFSQNTHNSAHISTLLIFRRSQFCMKSIESKSTTTFEINPEIVNETTPFEDQWNVHVGNPNLSPLYVAKLSLGDQAFYLMSFIACMTSIAFTSLVIAAVPAISAMGRVATSFAKLADTAREELPSTMAAMRLSGLEMSDLTLELSDLSHEIADGVSKSTQVVQAAEAGIKKIGSLARQQTISIIEERASLPVISIQLIVVGAAKKSSRAVVQATKSLMSFISRDGINSEPEDEDELDRFGV